MYSFYKLIFGGVRFLLIEKKEIARNQYLVKFQCNNIDYANANDISIQMESILDNRQIDRIMFDLGNVEFIGSSGLLLFLNAKRKLETKNGKFAIINVKQELIQTLTTFNIPELMKSFKIFDNFKEAEKFLNE